ncbi:MAG: TylF/MycF/NovP-related O-methyltransferase [Blastocatellia bacterium]|nr:TylF/MycF/NovP-related O-methyltransferase [Blastocatellia bacterium]
MFRKLIGDVLRPVRVLAGKFVLPPKLTEENYVGTNGCVHTAASFVTWNQVAGDYLEFGVAEGQSFAAAFRAITRERRIHAGMGYDGPEYRQWLAAEPRFFAFDSFEGLPDGPAERQVDYFPGSYQCSEAQFKANLARDGVDMRRVVTVPGFYDKSLTPETRQRLGLRRAAVAMIDCDLYESTVPVLDFLTDLVGQGTVLIFHDWFRYQGNPNQGEQRACREWLARNPQFELIEYWREGPQAVSFLVNLKA